MPFRDIIWIEFVDSDQVRSNTNNGGRDLHHPLVRNNKRYFLILPYMFKGLGLNEEAWRAQLENYEHPMTHDAAECAYRAGEKQHGWDMLMASSVNIYNEKHIEKLAKEWLHHETTGEPLPPQGVFAIPKLYKSFRYYDMDAFDKELGTLYLHTPSIKVVPEVMFIAHNNPRLRDAMLRRISQPGLTEEEIRREYWDIIFKVYRTCKPAHPRLLELIEKYPEEFENPEELKKELQDEWIREMEDRYAALEKNKVDRAYMFGQQVYPEKVDPLSIKIPWAYPEGSVEATKKRLLDHLEATQKQAETKKAAETSSEQEQ